MAELHDNWKTLKKQIGDYAKLLPNDNFGKSLDELESAVVDFQKKCTELDAAYEKLLVKRKAANDTMGVYGTALTKDKKFNSSNHSTDWLKFVSSLKKPMIRAGTTFNSLQTKVEAPLKKMAGL